MNRRMFARALTMGVVGAVMLGKAPKPATSYEDVITLINSLTPHYRPKVMLFGPAYWDEDPSLTVDLTGWPAGN